LIFYVGVLFWWRQVWLFLQILPAAFLSLFEACLLVLSFLWRNCCWPTFLLCSLYFVCKASVDPSQVVTIRLQLVLAERTQSLDSKDRYPWSMMVDRKYANWGFENWKNSASYLIVP
jgi:hypothetical protein